MAGLQAAGEPQQCSGVSGQDRRCSAGSGSGSSLTLIIVGTPSSRCRGASARERGRPWPGSPGARWLASMTSMYLREYRN